jgi:hypothetical protein
MHRVVYLFRDALSRRPVIFNILVLVIFLVFYFIYIRKRYDNYIIVLTMIGMKVFAAGRPPALLASKDRVYKVPTVRTATGAV